MKRSEIGELDDEYRELTKKLADCRLKDRKEEIEELTKALDFVREKKKIVMRESRIKYWQTRPPFKNSDDIGDIPIMDEEDYKTYIIPNIIRCGGIPKKDLIKGCTYIGSCRNAEEAIWNGKEFVYKRYKFGFVYEDTVNHFEDDNGYDLFVPIQEIYNVHFDVVESDKINWIKP